MWTNIGTERLMHSMRCHDCTHVLWPYLQHLESVTDKMEVRQPRAMTLH
jgi:hypothetical protein